MCPHAAVYLSSSYYMCLQARMYVSSCCCAVLLSSIRIVCVLKSIRQHTRALTSAMYVSSCFAVLLSSIRIVFRACIIRCTVIALENRHTQQRAGEEVAGVRRLRAQARQATHTRACCIRIVLRTCLLRCAFISLENGHAQQRAGEKVAAVRRL